MPRKKDTDIDNYRKVIISNNMFKFFEYCQLPCINSANLSCCQFGYRQIRKLYYTIACSKENIGNDIEGNDLVYCCFLDMNKAFENVNHSILSKLTAKGVTPFIVIMFRRMFCRSEIIVCFDDCFSGSWRICRGVREDKNYFSFLPLFLLPLSHFIRNPCK